MFFVLRVLIMMLIVWVVWRLCASLFPAQRPKRESPPDDWTEVLESIQALPETSDPPPRTDDPGRRRHPEA